MAWTEAQRAAIDGDGNLIVSAAAGAGKTSVLTERVLRLMQDGMDLENMLILTFTRAAAGEMKMRIAKRLEEEIQKSSGEQKRRLRAQSAQVGNANISTIHAFCSKVVFRHFFRVGLTPSAKTMDETESAVLQNEVRETLLTALATDDPSAYRLLVQCFGGEAALIETLQHADRFLGAQPDPEAWLAEQEANTLDRNAFDRLLADDLLACQHELEMAMDELQNASSALPPACDGVLAVTDELLMHMRGALLQTERQPYGEALSFANETGRLNWPKDFSQEERAPITDAKSALLALARAQMASMATDADRLWQIEQQCTPYLTALFALLRSYREAYAAEKRARNVLDFNDLEHMTIAILKDDEIAAEYRERFETIIVDEYQDSNRVQESILQRIARPNTLFYVGDVKQSIYRFRMAEPKLFIEKCGAFCGDVGTRIDLPDNFRSGKAVIDAVNRVFGTVMRKEIAGIAYDERAALRQGRRQPDGLVELHLFEKSADSDEDAIEDAEAQARFAAQTIFSRMERPIVLDEQGTTRPCRYDDFVVLLRNKKHAALWQRTLAFCGIPCYAQTTGGYFDAIEVKLVLDLLRCIDNRRQNIPLLAVMRSPIGKFDDETLYRLRPASKKQTLLERLLEVRASDAQVDAFLSMLERYRSLSRRISMDALLCTIFDDTLFAEQMGALRGGEQRMANLDALTERACTFDKTGNSGVHGFLHYMENTAASADVGAAQTITANVVRIMTIHSAKGLEFPCVFLASLGSQYNHDDERKTLLLHAEKGVGLRYADADGVRYDAFSRRIISRAVADESWQEEQRVLYVGMTRAKSELYLLGSLLHVETALNKLPLPTLSKLRAANCPLRVLLLATQGALLPQVHFKREFSELETHTAPPIPAPTKDELQALSERFAWRYGWHETELLPDKTSVTAQQARDALTFEAPVFTDEADAKALGTRTHSILERLPLKMLSMDELSAVAARIGNVPPSHLCAVSWFLHTPLYERMCRSPRVEREWNFVFPMDATALLDTTVHETILLQGVIDACFLEDGSWVLLDYKTDHVEGDAKLHAARHQRQVDLYARALGALTQIPVRETYVVLLNANEIVRMA